MTIKITTETGLEFTFTHVLMVLSAGPEYVSVREQKPGFPVANHGIHLDEFTGRLVRLDVFED